MIEKLKALWKKIWTWITTVAIPAVKAWFIKNWMIVLNYLIIFIAYSIIYGKDGVVGAEVLLGLWLFASAAIGGWKWFTKKK
ncbi:MAG: hypothetical protein WC428_01270 [Candidatus Paceibacterota bacterium]